MKWKEFKEKVEAQGLKDDMEIGYIDYSGHFTDPEVSIFENDAYIE